MWFSEGKERRMRCNLICFPQTYFNTNPFWRVLVNINCWQNIFLLMLSRLESKCILLYMKKPRCSRMVRSIAETRAGLLSIIPMIFWPFHTTCFYYLLSLLGKTKSVGFVFLFFFYFPLQTMVLFFHLFAGFFPSLFITLNLELLKRQGQLLDNKIMNNLCLVDVYSQKMMTSSLCNSSHQLHRPSFYRIPPHPNSELLSHLVCNNNVTPKWVILGILS